LTLAISFTARAQITKIDQNKPAPFSGVLLSESTYKQIIADALLTDNLKQELAISRVQNEPEEGANPFTWFAWGALIGIGIGLAASK
jgi:hypothetical protein